MAEARLAVIATLRKGYDLDYIWRQVDCDLAKDSAGYYLQASESGGEPPGRWWGPGARALGLELGQVVEREPYDLLFGERKAPDGTPLGRPRGDGRKAAGIYAGLLAAEPHATSERMGVLRLEAARQARQSPLFFDLTLSLSKSVSIFHASLGENARLAREAGDAAGEEYWAGLVAEVDATGLQGSRIRYVAAGAAEVAGGRQHPRQGLGEGPEGGYDFGVECFIRTDGPGQIQPCTASSPSRRSNNMVAGISPIPGWATVRSSAPGAQNVSRIVR